MILNAAPSAKYAIIRQMTERDNNILNLSWLCELPGFLALAITNGLKPPTTEICA